MPWFKVDDGFFSHPKVIATEPAALGLWVLAGAWCSANLTDGFVPTHALPRLLADATELAEKLVTAGLWQRVRGGYRYHDWTTYNPTAESVVDNRKRAAERQREYRKRQAQREKRNGVTDIPTNTSLTVDSRVSNSVPTRPDPYSPSSRGEYRGGADARARAAPRAGPSEPDPSDPSVIRVCHLCDGDGARFEPGRRVPMTPYVRCNHRRDQDVSERRTFSDNADTVAALDRAEQRKRDIAACALCDDGGYVGRSLCNHDPEAADRAKRGSELVRSAMAERKRTPRESQDSNKGTG